MSDFARSTRLWKSRGVRLGLMGLAIFLLFVLAFDEPVSRALANWPESERAFFHWLTDFGEGAVVLVPALLVWGTSRIIAVTRRGYWSRWTWRAVSAMAGFAFAGVSLPGLAAALLKRLFGRARPLLLDEHGTFGFSFLQPSDWSLQGFPSGHATTSIAFATMLVLLFGRRWWWGLIPAGLIALSRVVIQMHFLSDIIVGALLGGAGAVLVARWYRANGWLFARDEAGWKNRMLPIVIRRFRAGRDNA